MTHLVRPKETNYFMATAQPSPTPKSSGASASWVPNPVPAPAPTVQLSGATAWNDAFNKGYNSANSNSNPYSGQIISGYDLGAGFVQGQQAYFNDLSKKTTTQKTSTPTTFSTVQTGQQVPQSTPDMASQESALMNEINNLYGQSEGIFNQQEASLNTQKTNALTSITGQSDIAKTEQKSALEEALNSAKTQINALNQSKQSANNEAIRSFNALTQSNQARFGTGSSAGGAVSEIVSQEFLRNQGTIREQYGNAVQKVYDFEQKAQSTYQLALQKLEQDISDKIAAVNDSFTQGLLQIATSRVANEQAKSQAKIDLMRSSLENARAIQNYKIESQIQLDSWLSQQKAQTASALQYAKSLATQAETNSFSSANSIQNINQSTLLGAGNGNAISNIYRPVASRTTNEDDFANSNYLNPWLS